ncbi:Rna Exonuclease 4 [Manis pentadactyla]|nr:Rna Exonuclease 4 [Manis pentadactyla]
MTLKFNKFGLRLKNERQLRKSEEEIGNRERGLSWQENGKRKTGRGKETAREEQENKETRRRFRNETLNTDIWRSLTSGTVAAESKSDRTVRGTYKRSHSLLSPSRGDTEFSRRAGFATALRQRTTGSYGGYRFLRK